MKASPAMPEQTLKDRVLAEVRAETWDVPEIGRQLGCGERMVFYHFRQGLPSRVVNHRRSQHAGRGGELLAPSIHDEDRMNRPQK